jgi:hypothetical protein
VRLRLLAMLVISALLLAACAPEVASPSSTLLPTDTETSAPTSTQTEPTSTPYTPELSPPTSQIPLSVVIQDVGIKHNYVDSGTARVYFLLVITDGYRQANSRFLPADGTFDFNSYQVIEIDQEIFSTDSVGDSLKVCILAFKQNDPEWKVSILLPALAEIERGLSWNDFRSAPEILSTIDRYMAKSTTEFVGGGDTLIGYYEDIWGMDESLGVGQYQAVGSDDFRIWFSVWSEEEPGPQPYPVLLPDVTLDIVDVVSTVRIDDFRTDIIRIKNDELHPVTISLKGGSSMMGTFCNDTIEVPPQACAWVEKDSFSDSWGIDSISYSLYFRDAELDNWSGDISVGLSRQVTLTEWRNSDGSTPLERTLVGTPVTLYVEAPGYTGETLTAAIRKVESDGGYSYLETIQIKISNGRGLGDWKAEWIPVEEDSLAYVFGIKGVYSKELTVVRKYERPPDAGIEDVSMPSYAEAGKLRTDTVTIRNDEPEDVVVRLKGSSSVDGRFYDSAVIIPAEGIISLEIQSSLATPGVRTINYTLYYQGVEFDSWSGPLEVR